MKTIESVLKKLSMLHDFNKKLQSFTLPPHRNTADKATEPTSAPVTGSESASKKEIAPADRS